MLKIVSVPHQVLSSPTKAVGKIDEKIKSLVFEMEETLVSQSDPQGVGLAANQVGLGLSIFLMKKGPTAETRVFINPKILELVNNSSKTKVSKRKNDKLEGCLSIPRIWGPVRRSSKVHLQYQDLTGNTYKKWFVGFEAVIIQHEMDHLKGIVFTNRVIEQNGVLFEEKNGELKRMSDI